MLTYDAEATVGGMIGGVGQRMLTGVSKKMAAEFFGNVDLVLAGGTTPPPIAVQEALTVGASSSVRPPDASVGQVFTAPAVVGRAGAAWPGFAVGVAVGAAAALGGALVGGWLSRRRN
jgi:hypothetical protein